MSSSLHQFQQHVLELCGLKEVKGVTKLQLNMEANTIPRIKIEVEKIVSGEISMTTREYTFAENED